MVHRHWLAVIAEGLFTDIVEHKDIQSCRYDFVVGKAFQSRSKDEAARLEVILCDGKVHNIGDVMTC